MSTDQEITDALKVARDRLDQGWCQFRIWDRFTDGVCGLGAINYAAYGRYVSFLSDVNTPAWELSQDLRRVVASSIPGARKGGESSIVKYNDLSTTTKEDMLTIFDKALADRGGL